MLHTALVNGICCEFTKIYNSRSDTEGVKSLRATGTHFMLEKWENNLKKHKSIIFSFQQFTDFFQIT
jgi:hypothetical protein